MLWNKQNENDKSVVQLHKYMHRDVDDSSVVRHRWRATDDRSKASSMTLCFKPCRISSIR